MSRQICFENRYKGFIGKTISAGSHILPDSIANVWMLIFKGIFNLAKIFIHLNEHEYLVGRYVEWLDNGRRADVISFKVFFLNNKQVYKK